MSTEKNTVSWINTARSPLRENLTSTLAHKDMETYGGRFEATMFPSLVSALQALVHDLKIDHMRLYVDGVITGLVNRGELYEYHNAKNLQPLRWVDGFNHARKYAVPLQSVQFTKGGLLTMLLKSGAQEDHLEFNFFNEGETVDGIVQTQEQDTSTVLRCENGSLYIVPTDSIAIING
jgi:hypothetical protein